MDFDLSPDQQSLQELAGRLFADLATPDRVAAVEEDSACFDATLWAQLAQAGLLGTGLPESVGGLGLGMVELALVCEELGRAVAPVPLVWTLSAAAALAAHGDTDQRQLLGRVINGDVLLTSALPQSAQGVSVNYGVLHGTLVGVAAAHLAAVILVPVADCLYLVDTTLPSVRVQPGQATDRQVHSAVTLDHVPAIALGGPGAADWLWQRSAVLLAAVQSGVTAGALRLAAEYTSGRLQFGKPLSSFQGVAFRAADGYIANSAIRATMLQAAWWLDQVDGAGAPTADPDAPTPTTDPRVTAYVLTAAWWAAQAGQECVHAVQHIHGGIGADLSYPVHRYFLWGKQLELMLGGGSALLARLGDTLAMAPSPGDELALT